MILEHKGHDKNLTKQRTLIQEILQFDFWKQIDYWKLPVSVKV